MKIVSKSMLICVVGAAVMCVSTNAAGDVGYRTTAAFKLAAKTLDAFEDDEYAPQVAPEIDVVKKLIKEGERLLLKRKSQQAALIAEQLPFHLELIKALLREAEQANQAKVLGTKVQELRKKLATLQVRHRRLILNRDGTRMTDAYPPKDGAK